MKTGNNHSKKIVWNLPKCKIILSEGYQDEKILLDKTKFFVNLFIIFLL